VLDLATMLVALGAFLFGPHWLLGAIRQADQCEAAGDPLGALAWTLAAVLGAYAVTLAFLVLVIQVARHSFAA